MKASKTVLAVLGMILAAVFIGSLQLLTDGAKPAEGPTAVTAPMEKDTYNSYGLQGLQTLSQVKLTEVDGKICYEDRVFRPFQYVPSNVKQFKRIIWALHGLHPELNYYVMPVPGRVLTEEGYDQDREEYGRFIADMEKSVGNKAVLLDPWPVLQERQDEYIFFRTEDSWTARGAYYGSVMLCEALGIEPFALEDYEENMYKDALGALAVTAAGDYAELYGQDSEIVGKLYNMTQDLFYLYQLPGAANLEEIYDKATGQKTRHPAVSQTRVGAAAFVGADFLHARVFGDGRSDAVKDETLLILTDGTGSGGDILVPYMAGYYKDVYVVSLQNDKGFLDRLDVLLKRFDIHSVVIVSGAHRMGDISYYLALRDLIS